MKKSRFTELQIVAILKEGQAGSTGSGWPACTSEPAPGNSSESSPATPGRPDKDDRRYWFVRLMNQLLCRWA
jgi:hypothetical protein